jgi:hypothetical protein
MPSSALRPEIVRRIERQNGAPAPVVEPESGRPVGVARARER